MKPTLFAFLVAILATIVPASARTIVSLDPGWSFYQGEATGSEKPEFAAADWQKVNVPHDWSIAGPFDKAAPATGSVAGLPTGVAWYRKEITLPADARGKRVWVEFDGVMANSDVWINGHLLGHRPSGYFSFHHDLTDQLKPDGPNLLVAKADTSAQPASRWYAGSGIYRHARLVTTHPVHVEPWGVYVATSDATDAAAIVKAQITLANNIAKSGKVTVRAAVVNPGGKTVATLDTEVTLAPDRPSTVSQQLKIPHPQLWSLKAPQLHSLVTRITGGDTVSDEVTTPFGIRNAEFKSDTGFWLNGKISSSREFVSIRMVVRSAWRCR